MRVLVVDDEVRLAEAVARGLRAEGFDVEISHDGLDALWLAKEREYAAIVLDLLLPGMNGFEICRELRAAGVWTPILMLTAKSGEYDEAEALDTGADDFLSKPFSFVVLVARVRAVARRGAAPRPTVLTVGDVTVDPARREVTVAGTAVGLSPREFALLEALARRAPDVLTKGELLDEVWGVDRDVDPNAVEVYVGYLRRKLDAPFGRQAIQTVRGAGYRLVAAGDRS
ncbi:MAG: response regulator transcription factor [Acidimicrobiales bacterium]